MRLIDVYKAGPEAVNILYWLLLERTAISNISHREPVLFRDHEAFFRGQPYHAWYLAHVGHFVGACYITKRNELGVQIFHKEQRKGYARAALRELLSTHKPLEAIPGERQDRFVANINPANDASIRMVAALGFKGPISKTYELPEENFNERYR